MAGAVIEAWLLNLLTWSVVLLRTLRILLFAIPEFDPWSIEVKRL
jgi:hypothetical protein